MLKPDTDRMQFTLSRSLIHRLTNTASGRASRSAIVETALSAWLDRSGDDELELRFAQRLDRISAQLARIERIANIEVESLALFIRYMLTINAPIAEDDEAARALGRDRFAAFIQRVATQLASGRRRTLDPEEEE